MVNNRSAGMFSRASSSPTECTPFQHRRSFEDSGQEDGESVASTVLASALMSLSATLPATATHTFDSADPSSIASFAADGKGEDGVSTLSLSRRVSHFIETSTLRSRVLHEDPPEALAAAHAHGAHVSHQINSSLDSGSVLHIVAYVPAVRFPAAVTGYSGVQDFVPESSVFDVAIRLGRPCDQVDVLLAPSVQKEPFHADAAMRYFQMRVMQMSRSPLHRVLAVPYERKNVQAASFEAPGVVSFARIRKTKSAAAAGTVGAASHPGESSPAVPVAHSLKELLLEGPGADTMGESSALFESTEDALLEYVRGCLQSSSISHMPSANSRSAQTAGDTKPPPMLVLVKGLDHVFKCPNHVPALEDRKHRRTIMLVPPQTGASASVSPYACVSRFVCMISHGERSRFAFHAALRLSKPGDMLFLVHVWRRSPAGPYDEQAVQSLARKYKKLGFNLEIVPEDEVAPRGIADNLQLGKALVSAAAVHMPTHMVLGADHDDADFALFQHSVSSEASTLEGVIRQEKFLCSAFQDREGGDARRPVLVLGTAV